MLRTYSKATENLTIITEVGDDFRGVMHVRDHSIVYWLSVQFSSSVLTVCNPMDCSIPGFPVHHQLLDLTQTHVPLSQWCHPTISSSVVPFSSHLQSFPGSGSFQMSQFFASGGQSIGISVSASVLPMKSSVYLRWLVFLLEILIPACASCSLAFCMMYSACKLNKQGDNTQPCCISFLICNQSVVPCAVKLLTDMHTDF